MKLRAFSTLQLALGVSVLVHAAVLTVRFVDPESFNRVFRDTPLEVVLVNAHSQDQPDQARAIAQARLAGGGDALQSRASNPLPYAKLDESGDSAEDQTQRSLQRLQQQQTRLLAQVRQQIAALAPPEADTPSELLDKAEREARRRQLVRLLAEIERRINDENSRPRKRYIGPSTREESYALYYDRLRRAIEQKGTDNFPQSGGRKLYGELTMMVTINHDGRLLATSIVESSGNKALDLQAEAIARSSAPFGRFSNEMRRKADQIVVVSRFKFTRDETLETRVSTGGR